jgi:hypothetical protein
MESGLMTDGALLGGHNTAAPSPATTLSARRVPTSSSVASSANQQPGHESSPATALSGNESGVIAQADSPTNAQVDAQVDAWGEEEFEDDGNWFGDESVAFVGSLLVHLSVIVMLGLTPLIPKLDREAIVIVSSPADESLEPIQIIDEVTYSETPQDKLGAASMGDFAMAEASAEMFSEMAEIPSPVQIEPDVRGDLLVNNLFSQPVAPLNKLKAQKGKIGQGEQGAAGAVDRLTFEILQALEERPTLVVWLFDQSGSLHRQRAEIRERFDHIYEELGIVEQSGGKGFRKSTKDIPLLTSVIGFGQEVKLYTEEPISGLEEIKSIVDSIPVDSSGIERVFTAVELAADRYAPFRKNIAGNGPRRNVLLVVVTDERGDDIDRLEPSIALCKRWGMPVYVIGVPAPFGREHTLVKYVDPDPKYDQTPQWAQVDQGPETLMSERVQVGFSGNFQEEPVIDSGFGPFGLTRLCYETGGIYFTVHPNRNINREVRRSEIDPFAADLKHFFDPAIMSRYRPDYVSPTDYQQRVKASPLRTALVTAAMQVAPTLDRPQTRFVKRDEAGLVGDLTKAQQAAAKLEPTLTRLAAVLEPGMAVREQESTPRWQAGYDLAYGRVLAQKVRTETYNAMLAKLKRGMSFENTKNNTWLIEPADEISVGSKWEREATLAKETLEQVVKEHPGTPWAMLAADELKTPIGWRWKEEFTDLAPRLAMNPGNNNNPAPPKDDEKRMLPQAPKRPIPKL